MVSNFWPRHALVDNQLDFFDILLGLSVDRFAIRIADDGNRQIKDEINRPLYAVGFRVFPIVRWSIVSLGRNSSR
jgi:hypothetical protein